MTTPDPPGFWRRRKNGLIRVGRNGSQAIPIAQVVQVTISVFNLAPAGSRNRDRVHTPADRIQVAQDLLQLPVSLYMRRDDPHAGGAAKPVKFTKMTARVGQVATT